MMQDEAENVRVVVRVRPLNAKETDMGTQACIRCNPDGRSLTISDYMEPHSFAFGRIFSEYSTQSDVFNELVDPILDAVTGGFHAAVIAYGQTGSGKTHTMVGKHVADQYSWKNTIKAGNDDRGLIPRLLQSLYRRIQKIDPNEDWACSVSYVQIYKEQVLDLLSEDYQRCEIYEDRSRGLWITNATSILAPSPRDVQEVLDKGEQNKIFAQTNMNSHSSRSHSVLILSVSKRTLSDGSEQISQLYLVDLAGSESVDKTGSEGDTLEEAKAINYSLLALRNVITALVEKKPFINYRDSKLTRLLQNAFGGNSKTTMIACVSPSTYNHRESMSTLRFADSTRLIENRAVANIHRSPQELMRMLQATKAEVAQTVNEIKMLESLLREGVEMEEEDDEGDGAEAVEHHYDGGATDDFSRCESIATAPVQALPNAFRCPLSGKLMIQPAVAANGYTYDIHALATYLATHGVTPPIRDGIPGIADETVFPNNMLSQQIALFNKQHGIS